jgi:hypothetical protein
MKTVFKLSHLQWEYIGQKAGWIKNAQSAQLNDNEQNQNTPEMIQAKKLLSDIHNKMEYYGAKFKKTAVKYFEYAGHPSVNPSELRKGFSEISDAEQPCDATVVINVVEEHKNNMRAFHLFVEVNKIAWGAYRGLHPTPPEKWKVILDQIITYFGFKTQVNLDDYGVRFALEVHFTTMESIPLKPHEPINPERLEGLNIFEDL